MTTTLVRDRQTETLPTTATAPRKRSRRRPFRKAAYMLVLDLSHFLLGDDPARHSPYRIERWSHWGRTIIRFGILYATAFIVECALVWWFLIAAVIHLWLLT